MVQCTHWRYEISIVRPDGKRHNGILTSGRASMKSALAEAIKDATHYCGIGYPGVTIEMQEVCGHCDGTGRVVVKRSKRSRFGTVKPCPDCKGQPVVTNFGPIPVSLASSLVNQLNQETVLA